MTTTPPHPPTTQDYMACEQVLHSLLALSAHSPLDQSGPACSASHLVTNDFNFATLDWNPEGIRKIISRESRDDSIILCFLSTGGYPFRTTLMQEQGQWRIRILQPGCPVCLADGIHEGKSCSFCDGTGYHTDPTEDHLRR